jgi:hypothetical protein
MEALAVVKDLQILKNDRANALGTHSDSRQGNPGIFYGNCWIKCHIVSPKNPIPTSAFRGHREASQQAGLAERPKRRDVNAELHLLLLLTVAH